MSADVRTRPALQDILAGIDKLDAPATARDQFRRLVMQTGLAHGITAMVRAERIDYASRLLRARISRATIRDRLMATFQISRSQAYTLMQEALSKNRAISWTHIEYSKA